MVSTDIASTIPITTFPISALSPAVNEFINAVMMIAPTRGPAQCLVPPKMLIKTTVSGTVILKISPTVTYETYIAWMAPITPAKKLEIANASILSLNAGTPLTCAASSSS